MSRVAKRHKADPKWSTHVIAVNGSFSPGERARTAISTSWFTPNSRSWSEVRRWPRTKRDWTWSVSRSVTLLPGQTSASGQLATTSVSYTHLRAHETRHDL